MTARRFEWKGVRRHRHLDDAAGIHSPVVLALEGAVPVEPEETSRLMSVLGARANRALNESRGW
jgi:hypothetical protein